MKVSREMVFMNRRLFPFNGNITVMLENYISAKLSKEQYKVVLQLWCFKQFCLHLFHLQLVKVKLSLTGGCVISASEVLAYFYTVKSIFASLLQSYNIVLSILAKRSLKGILKGIFTKSKVFLRPCYEATTLFCPFWQNAA